VNIYDYHKWRKSLSPMQQQGLVLLDNIFNDFLEKTSSREDEQDVNYVEIINQIITGPMEKKGTTWQQVLIEIDNWNETMGTGDVDDEWLPIDAQLFRETLYKYWGKKI